MTIRIDDLNAAAELSDDALDNVIGGLRGAARAPGRIW